MNSYAPIILFTYCRPDHTRRTVEALKHNELAVDSDIFIYSDAAKNHNAEIGVKQTREYLKTIEGFKSITIIEREKNWGLANSLIDGISTVINKYGYAIIVEDDIVTSPYFLRFMNDALIKYRENMSVGVIHGYTMNLGDNMPDTFLTTWIGCWGWATWKNRWDDFNPDALFLYNKIISDKSNIYCFDMDLSYQFTKMLRYQVEGKIDSWAIRWNASNFLKGRMGLQPGHSLVCPIGLDGAAGATHSSSSHSYDVILSDKPVNILSDLKTEDYVVRKRLSVFYNNVIGKKSKLARIFYLMGLNKFIVKYSNSFSWI